MDVLIVSKTHMSNASCVGGIAINGRSVRLLDENGYNQPTNTDFQVRQVWNIEFRERPNPAAPHLEDVLVVSRELKGTLKDDLTMHQIVERFDVPVWRGSPDGLFNNFLLWTNNGSGYISRDGQIPSQSVGFWIPDRDLTKRIFYERVRYNYPNINGCRSLPYVGFDRAIDVIPSGTLVRVSLARWWDRNGETEDRCALQLSGWYDLPQKHDEEEVDDLPF
jgi:hypothetical protein